jgi:hypothetical protein
VLLDNFDNSRHDSALDWISSLGPKAFFTRNALGALIH